MNDLIVKLKTAEAALSGLLEVSWWTLSAEEEEEHALKLKAAMDQIEELQRRIICTTEVRAQARAMHNNTFVS